MEKRLTALRVASLKAKGVYPDGGGLYLQVTIGANGTPRKSWFYRFTSPKERKERLMGLGSLDSVPLADARLARDRARAVLQTGKDPIENRNRAREQTAIESAKSITFDQCAEAYIGAHRAAWKNPKHRQQWSNTLATYVTPVLGALPVASVDTSLVMRVLEPVWTSKPETASRLRGRIESILAWATVRGYRTNPNPAQFKNHLDHLLPAIGKVRRVKHHRAMDYREVATFLHALEQQEGLAALALRFAILTACRTNEVLGAKWDEIDWPAKIWTIPAERMKGGRAHRVPLPPEVICILENLANTAQAVLAISQPSTETVFLFPGSKRDKPLSNMSMLMLLRRMGKKVTTHGFRSSFRDWAGNETHHAKETCEAALAHASGDSTERAYRRSDAIEKRRLLMDDWAEYLSTKK